MKKKSIIFLVMVLLLLKMDSFVMADTATEIPSFEMCQGIAFSGFEYKQTNTIRVPVYSFYSAYTRDSFWTAFESEKNQLIDRYYLGTDTYQYQGVSGYVEQTPTEQNMPVYRFWNSKTMDHFYTTNEVEKEQLTNDFNIGRDQYQYEGIAWYVPKMTGIPVYRFFDVLNYNHFYTSDELMKDSLSLEYMNGTGLYRYEGIAWYWYK